MIMLPLHGQYTAAIKYQVKDFSARNFQILGKSRSELIDLRRFVNITATAGLVQYPVYCTFPVFMSDI